MASWQDLPQKDLMKLCKEAFDTMKQSRAAEEEKSVTLQLEEECEKKRQSQQRQQQKSQPRARAKPKCARVTSESEMAIAPSPAPVSESSEPQGRKNQGTKTQSQKLGACPKSEPLQKRARVKKEKPDSQVTGGLVPAAPKQQRVKEEPGNSIVLAESPRPEKKRGRHAPGSRPMAYKKRNHALGYYSICACT